MRKDRKNLYFVVAVTLVALGVFGTALVHAFWYDPESVEAILPNLSLGGPEQKNTKNTSDKKAPISPNKLEKPVTLGHPVRLVIPTLEINAKIQKVGINKKGNMATPSNFKDVGWYKYGTMPGDVGSAVMAGHVDNGLAFSGVFKRIGDLEKGDDVYVDTDDGRRILFVVTGAEVYDYDAPAPEVFRENDGRYLKLVTCTGTWVESARTHGERLVVTAVKSI